MKTNRKALLLLLCVMVLLAGAVFGTLAYFTDSDADTNTFTVGSVHIDLDEAEVNPDGSKKSENRVQKNEYHLLPGHTYIKDPTVTVEAGSSDAYVRMLVKVENIDRLIAALPEAETILGDDGTTAQIAYPQNSKYYGEDGVFLLQNLVAGWDNTTWIYEKYSKDGTTGIYEFRYKEIVEQSDSNTVLDALFDTITVPGEIDNDHIAFLKDVKINVEAHAIQAPGFDSADAAWVAFGAQHPGV